MTGEIVRVGVAIERESAVDDPDQRVAGVLGEAVGAPEQVRARKAVHRDNLTVLQGNIRRGLALVRRRTRRTEPLSVRLYERVGCHLCDRTHRALLRAGLPLEIERIDVDTDDTLSRRYTLRVPVVAVGAAELDAAGLDDAAITRWLHERGAGQ